MDRCNCCGKPGHKECTGCNLEVYCSVECQEESWPQHKVECDQEVEAVEAIVLGRRKKLTIATYLNQTRQFREFHRHIVESNLIGTLSAGDWTVFAPTNDAISNFRANESNLNPGKLSMETIMKFHIVRGTLDKKTMMRHPTGSRETLAGSDLPYSYNKKTRSLMVGQNVEVTRTGITLGNGTIHRVNSVLVPRSS